MASDGKVPSASTVTSVGNQLYPSSMKVMTGYAD